METISAPSYPSKQTSVAAVTESATEIPNSHLSSEVDTEVVPSPPEPTIAEEAESANADPHVGPLLPSVLDSVPEGISDIASLAQAEMEEPNLEMPLPMEVYIEEYPPYPPPPYPTGEPDNLGEDSFNMQPPEVTGQFSLPPVSKKEFHLWSK